MHYNLKPNKPRPLSAVAAAFTGDARWRGVPKRVSHIDGVARRDLQRRQRNKGRKL